MLRRIVSRVSRFRALAREDRAAFLTAFFLLPIYSFASALYRGSRLQRTLRPSGPHPSFSAEHVKRMAWAVDTAARNSLIPVSCLPRSLLLARMLQGHGAVCIGVRPGRGGIEAHAWVEWEGLPLNERADVRQQFPILEAPAALASPRWSP